MSATYCGYCGKAFDSLGIARHQAACRKKHSEGFRYSDEGDVVLKTDDEGVDYVVARVTGDNMDYETKEAVVEMVALAVIAQEKGLLS